VSATVSSGGKAPGRDAAGARAPTPLSAAAGGLDLCVHCGFCLQACPTYLALGDENDSPRGRVLLMRAVVENELAIDDPSVDAHLDRCLGCRGCETACPSGVPYGHLLEAARATRSATRALPLRARAVLRAVATPWLLRTVALGARLLRWSGVARVLAALPGRAGFAFAMLTASAPARRRVAYRARGDGSRGKVAVLQGCVMEAIFGATNRATERTLLVNDYQLVPAAGQGCCGALHAHAGDTTTAASLARRNIEAFERSGAEFIAVNASGCGAAMKEYGLLLADDPAWRERALRFAARVRDVSELLAAAGPRPGGAVPLRASYDAPCHLLHAQRVSRPPLQTLGAIPALTLVPLRDSDQCCGSAGIYNLLEPETSDAVLAPKLANIAAAGADVVVTGNPGCLMQIGAGLLRGRSRARAVHLVDLLDASYAAASGTARSGE
jgi:glycolate oxidase iron-sulfur subunit